MALLENGSQALLLLQRGTTTALVAGVLTVACPAIEAGSVILVNASVPAGTAGALRISAITAGTSFQITSTSNTETSTVNYVVYNPA